MRTQNVVYAIAPFFRFGGDAQPIKILASTAVTINPLNASPQKISLQIRFIRLQAPMILIPDCQLFHFQLHEHIRRAKRGIEGGRTTDHCASSQITFDDRRELS